MRRVRPSLRGEPSGAAPRRLVLTCRSTWLSRSPRGAGGQPGLCGGSEFLKARAGLGIGAGGNGPAWPSPS